MADKLLRRGSFAPQKLNYPPLTTEYALDRTYRVATICLTSHHFLHFPLLMDPIIQNKEWDRVMERLNKEVSRHFIHNYVKLAYEEYC